VSPFYSPATGTVPCVAMWYDARARQTRAVVAAGLAGRLRWRP
jgi:hypothetical protein